MCFTFMWFEQLLIWLVELAVAYGIYKAVVPYLLSKLAIFLGDAVPVITTVLNWIIWGIMAVLVIILLFDVVGCLWSMVSAGGMNLMPRIR
jgi:hypothetical protein